MTLNQFVSKYTGKFVEYHSYNPAAVFQCTDLANQYIVEVLGLTPIIGTNAQDFPKKKGNEWNYVENSPTGVPNKGDLVIFKSADNVGHISIFLQGNASLFTSFDQNYPTGSPCKSVQHNYRNVLGWLQPKESDMSSELEVCLKDRQKFWDERDSLLRELNAENVEGGIASIRGLRSRITDLGNQLGALQAEITNRREQVSRIEAQLLDTQAQLKLIDEQLKVALNDLKIRSIEKGALAIEVEQLKVQIDTLKQAQTQGSLTLTIGEVLRLILKQKITIKK